KLVETRGRSPESSKEYFAHESPIFENIPLAVLINGNSASASEIVAGCIQDLDRGIVTGSQSFGKGLVQTVIPIAYNTMLKMTTAKYYTPSGRCIQKLDYMHTSKGTFVTKPDSLKKLFYTKNKRKVYEAGGVTPDSIISSNDYSEITQELLKQGMFFKFTTHYLSKNKDLNLKDFPQQKLLDTFTAFLYEQKFKVENKIHSKFEELTNLLSNTKSYSKLVTELNAIKEKAKFNLEAEINSNKEEIYYLLISELNSRIEGENGRIKSLLNFDKQINETVKIVSNQKLYSKLLSAN
ncbi:MAG: S41 family peptidase, partial [Ignavibacteria bacterium]|nr:S41 family peptidase [Ignavibacteria bacterium]